MCIIATIVIIVVCVAIGFNYRFLIRHEVSGEEYPIIGDDSIMSPKANGSTEDPV